MAIAKRKLELLAPAQNKECALAAINFGADSVYIGANLYGARQNAKNSLEDIEEIINYAHKFNVKIYVTVNTILTDDELISAVEMIRKLHKIGADGIIFQDFGLLTQDLPDIKLIASTQCDIRSLEKVKFFENLGVKRVILARELSLEAIKNICKNTNIEIETFIHGALCVSYSGRCYLSQYIGKRSANRGECAQACRKKYSLYDEKGKVIARDKYLLSLKDFNASNRLEELIDAGVTSFKIEGRLKDAEYVKNTVAHYRRLLDEIIEKRGDVQRASCGKTFLDFEPSLKKTFNRGFCEYFLDGKRRNIYNFDTPNFKGEKIGTVIKTGRNFIEIRKEKGAEIHAQDGLCFIENNKLFGILTNTAEGNKIYPNITQEFKFPKEGAEIFRNRDVKFEETLKKSETRRKIKAVFRVKDYVLECEDEEKNRVNLPFEADFAENEERAKDSWQKALKKAGESIFYIENVEFEGKNTYFLPASKMNELRRTALLKLENLRLKNYKKETQEPIHPAPYPAPNGDYKLNVHNKKAEEFYKKCGCEILEKSFESGRNKDKQTELMRTKHCLRHAFNMCLKNKNVYKGGLLLTDEKGAKYPLAFDCANCEMILLSNVTK